MAADGFHPEPAVIGAGATVIGAVLAWLGTRLVGKAAIQNAVNAGFKELMEQLRQELRVAIHERDEARDEATSHRVRIEELERTIQALELRLAAANLPRV